MNILDEKAKRRLKAEDDGPDYESCNSNFEIGTPIWDSKKELRFQKFLMTKHWSEISEDWTQVSDTIQFEGNTVSYSAWVKRGSHNDESQIADVAATII